MASRPTRLALSASLAVAVMAAGGGMVHAAPADFPDGFRAHHTYAELRAELQGVAAAHPSIVSLRSIGRTFEGRKLLAVKISDAVKVDESEPEVYVDGGIHGHEHASTEQALALIHWLVDGYGTNERTTAIVDSTEAWILPMVNPDGAMHDISGGEFHHWRKNRQPNSDGPLGTDVNRNFGYRWGGAGSSATPDDDFYRGSGAWSTPEARRIRDFVRSRRTGNGQQIRLALTIHSQGEFVMFPFGWTSNPEPEGMRSGDLALLADLADGVATRNGYRAVQAGQLYRSSGTFMDWAYAKQWIYALTLEMAPPVSVENGWYLPDDDLAIELERNRDALLWFLEQAQKLG